MSLKSKLGDISEYSIDEEIVVSGISGKYPGNIDLTHLKLSFAYS